MRLVVQCVLLWLTTTYLISAADLVTGLRDESKVQDSAKKRKNILSQVKLDTSDFEEYDNHLETAHIPLKIETHCNSPYILTI